MIISLSIISLTYCGSSFALNMMQPFDQFDLSASYPTAFKNIKFMYWICSVGPILSLTGSLLIGIFTIARATLTMSKDGLFFKFLSHVNERTQVPDFATITSLILCVILVIFFDVPSLVGFSDVTSFLTYSLIGMGILVVRYVHDDFGQNKLNTNIVNIAENSFVVSTSQSDESERLLPHQNQNNHNSTNELKGISFFENFQSKFSNYSFFRSNVNSLFVIIYIYFSNIAFFGLLNTFDEIKYPLLVFFVLTNIASIMVLSIFKQSKASALATFKVNLLFISKHGEILCIFSSLETNLKFRLINTGYSEVKKKRFLKNLILI